MSNKLQVAVIGAGQIAQRGHLPGYTQVGAEIVALCDNTHPDLEATASRFQVKRVYRDWRTMLKEGGFDAISICTPPFLHCEMAVEAMHAGYHVLVEKPMAMTLAECDQMIAASTQTGKLLMISHNQRYIPAHQLAKKIIDSGDLGKPYLVHAVFGHSGPEAWSPTARWVFQPDRAGHGVMADLGIHKLDLIQWMTGQTVVQIGAFCQTFEKVTTLEDSAVFSFQLSGGALGTMQVSWIFRPDWENSLTIRGERGVIQIPTEADAPLKVRRLDAHGMVIESDHVCKASDSSGWASTVQAFVAAVQTSSPSPVSGEEGKAAMAAMLAAADSFKQRKIVSLI